MDFTHTEKQVVVRLIKNPKLRLKEKRERHLIGDDRHPLFLFPETSLSSLCPDVIEHVLLLLLLPLLLQHLRGHHRLHLIRVVVLTLGGVAEEEPPQHHHAAHRHQNNAHDGAQFQSHPQSPWRLLSCRSESSNKSLVVLDPPQHHHTAH